MNNSEEKQTVIVTPTERLTKNQHELVKLELESLSSKGKVRFSLMPHGFECQQLTDTDKLIQSFNEATKAMKAMAESTAMLAQAISEDYVDEEDHQGPVYLDEPAHEQRED